MKKKPLAPQAQILWFSVLHQLSIPGLSPQSQHQRGPRRGGCCPAPGRLWPREPRTSPADAISRCGTPTPGSSARSPRASGGLGRDRRPPRVRAPHPHPRAVRVPPRGRLSRREARTGPWQPRPPGAPHSGQEAQDEGGSLPSGDAGLFPGSGSLA